MSKQKDNRKDHVTKKE